MLDRIPLFTYYTHMIINNAPTYNSVLFPRIKASAFVWILKRCVIRT